MPRDEESSWPGASGPSSPSSLGGDRPWVIRDVPERIRREVKVYAAQHHLTMAQALEALVDIVFFKPDKQLEAALLHLYRYVISDNLAEAKLEAEQVRQLLTRVKWDDGQG